jgi:hypothetical protein
MFHDGRGWREPTAIEWRMARAFMTIDNILADASAGFHSLSSDTVARVRAIEPNPS